MIPAPGGSRAIGLGVVLLLLVAITGEGGAAPTVLLLTHGLALGLVIVALGSRTGSTLSWSKTSVALFALFVALAVANATLGPYFYAAFLVLLEMATFTAVAFLAALDGRGFPAFATWTLFAAAAAESCAVLFSWMEGQPRPAGTFLNPSHLAAWLSAVLLLALGRSLAGRAFFLRAAGAVPIVLAMFATGSRGAALGLAAGVCLLLRGVFRYGERKTRLGAASVALVVLGVVVLGVVIRFREVDPYRYQRLAIWRASLAVSLESPFRGTGPGQFPEAAANANFPTTEGPLRYERFFTATHSDLLRLPCELGYPGAIVGLLALGFAVREMRGVRPGGDRAADLGVKAALLCLGVQSLVENLSERPAVYLLAAALLGSLLSEPSSARPRSVPGRLSLSLLLATLFLVGDVAPYLAWRSVKDLPRGRLAPDQHERLATALRRNPMHPDLWQRRAETIAGDGSDWTVEGYVAARQDAERAVRLQPAAAAFRCGLARIEALACKTLFQDRGTSSRAVARYEEASARATHDALLPVEEAFFLLSVGDPAGARRAANAALAIEPLALPPRLVLAETALLEGGPSAAREAARFLDEAEEIAARWDAWPKESRYARQLLLLDAAQVHETRRRIAEWTGAGERR